MEIINVKIDDLKDSEYNPREMTSVEFQKLKNSIESFGLVEPIIINSDFQIIGGHMRRKACKELGWTEVPCFKVDLDKKKEKLLNLALNRIGGRWDRNKLEVLITDLKLDKTTFDELNLSGFDQWEFDYYDKSVDATPDVPTYGIKTPMVTDPTTGEQVRADMIQGNVDNKGDYLIIRCKDQSEMEEISKYFNEGKIMKTISSESIFAKIRN